ncbi:LPS assembly lipoprotein LptE [Silicimonas sp. MF1-12-2]|jgi:LPS-assembly lipoprotein|uniref:LPS assembly lipoprotein LptE n=1 Tax=Silicimonas sp. MF1-12-2 TaxID=3384793 RepID=UPI0039B4D310
MSSYSRRTLLLSLTALSACGFEPVYAPGGRAEGLRGRIDLAAPADEEGYALVERLEQRLGQPAGADLGMTADIYVSEEAVGFLPDGTISRYNVSGRVDWRLTRLIDGTELLTGSERGFTGYSATSTTVATISARRDARRRLMVILADRVLQDIVLRADAL